MQKVESIKQKEIKLTILFKNNSCMPKYTMKKIKDKSQTGRWYLESVYQMTLIKNSFKILRKGKHFNEKEIDN